MDIKKLNDVATQMVAPGKGILAADESMATAGKRLAKIGIENTEENRLGYRTMLLTTPGLGKYISGVILHEETLRQSTADGRTFVSILQGEGVFPGIKVDQSTAPMEGSPEESITKGLGDLAERCSEYVKLGAKFTKWRAVITIGAGFPSEANIKQNAKDLAAYAKIVQEAGMVPIVEPEVLMEGAHDIAACREASERILVALFEELKSAGASIEGLVLKTNMVVPGKDNRKAPPGEVADATLALFKKVLPNELPGQAFLSGGQAEVEATENLNEMNKRGPHQWKLTFSYGRALQDSALKAWNGKPENLPAAQAALMKRAEMNSLATLGKYQGE